MYIYNLPDSVKLFMPILCRVNREIEEKNNVRTPFFMDYLMAFCQLKLRRRLPEKLCLPFDFDIIKLNKRSLTQ